MQRSKPDSPHVLPGGRLDILIYNWGSACSRSTRVHSVSASQASHEGASVCKSAALAVCNLTGLPCSQHGYWHSETLQQLLHSRSAAILTCAWG